MTAIAVPRASRPARRHTWGAPPRSAPRAVADGALRHTVRVLHRVEAMNTRTLFPLHAFGAARTAAPDVPLPPAYNAEEGDVDIVGEGRVHYYADREIKGRPVVLVHSVNAAASSYEMHPLFEALRGARRVFALDLPGFGRSAREARAYTPNGYARAIERFIVDVASPQGIPCDVAALSLSCEFVARAALANSAIFHRLVFISPTGMSSKHPSRALEAVRRRALGALLHVGPIGRGVFKLITAERVVRHYLARAFAGPVDEGLVSYAVRSAHERGAEHAPLAFLSGGLFTPDASSSLYEPLRVPTEVLYDEDPYTDFGGLGALVEKNANLHARRVESAHSMIQFGHTADVVAALNREEAPTHGT